MKKEALRVSTTVPSAPTTVYFAWLTAEQHSAMTESPAKIDQTVGGKYTARDGYISGKLVTLDLGRRIVMSWRTTDFPREDHDSRVEIHFEALGGSTRILVLHTEIPEGQGEKYRALWNDNYFTPMRNYFSKYLPDPRLPPPPRRPIPPEDEEEEEEAPPKKKAKVKAPKVSPLARPSTVDLSPSAKSSPAKSPPAKVPPAMPAQGKGLRLPPPAKSVPVAAKSVSPTPPPAKAAKSVPAAPAKSAPPKSAPKAAKGAPAKAAKPTKEAPKAAKPTKPTKAPAKAAKKPAAKAPAKAPKAATKKPAKAAAKKPAAKGKKK